MQTARRKTGRKGKQRVLKCESLEDRRLLTTDFLPGDADIGPSFNKQTFAAVEAGGDGYLAVWTDERAVLSNTVNSTNPISGSGQDIYGQLLNTTGLPVGEPIVIANSGRNQAKPDVAWNESSQSWLVVFDSEDPDWYFNDQVYGVRVAADATVLDAEPILLYEQVGNQGIFDADVASDGENWTIVASKFHGSPLEGAIFGRRMAADGTLLEMQPTMIVQQDLMFPDIAFADNTYMIVAKHRVSDNYYVTRMDATLNPIGSTMFVGTSSFAGPHIASNGTDFMVLGDKAHRITAAGQNLDPTGIAIGGSLSAGIHRDVTWSGGEWSVGMRTPLTNVGVQRIGSDGSLIDADPIVVAAASLTEQVAMAGAGGESVILFADRPGFDQDIRAAHIDSSGTASGLIDVSIGMARQNKLTTVDGPAGENLVVYLSEVSGQTRILSQRVADDGTVIDAEPTVVEAFSPGFTGTPQVAWNGSVYMVAWNNVARRVSASNQVLDAQAITVSDLPVGAVAAAGDTFVVGLFDYQAFHEPLNYMVFVRVAGDGTVLDVEPQFVAGGFAREMTAESFGDKAILAWAQYGRHDSPAAYTQAVIVNAAGQYNGTLRVSNESGKTPDIAVNGNQALVVYADDGTIHEDDVEGRFVLSDGSMPEWEFPISTAPNKQIVPDASWIGDQYVVAWNDYRHVEGIQQDRANIRAARVLADGTVREPNGFTVTDSALPEDLPAVVGGNGNSWILYSAMHGPGEADEIQRIGYQYGPLVDYVVNPFERTAADGSQVSSSEGNVGVLAFAAETHRYDVGVEAGERVTAMVTPVDDTVTLTAEFVGLGSSVTAAAPGAAVIVPLTDVDGGGNVTLSISGDGPTAYQFELHRNTNLESLVESVTVANINDARVDLGDGASFAAFGQSNGQVGGAGFDHYNDPGLFVDISGTGTSLVLDDGFYGNRAFVSTTVGNDALPAGTVTVARDGVLVGGFNDTYLGAHQTLPNSLYLGNAPALAPLWQILGANNSTGLGDGAVYVEEREVGGIDTLIVQWHEVPAWHDFGAATFQIQVFASGPVKSRFVYQDITFGDPNRDGGAAASIGVQLNSSLAYQFSFETPSVADGDVVDFLNQATIEDVDDMAVDLLAGDTVDVSLTGVDQTMTEATLELLDAGGNLLATGSTSFDGQTIANFDQGILGYDVLADGTYTVRVHSDVESRYAVTVAEAFTLDTEPNNSAPLRRIDNTQGSLGRLESQPALGGYSHYNDATRFVDISTSGEELFFDHGDGIARVNTNIGNALIPAGKLLVGTDGVLMQDENIAAFSGYSRVELPNAFFEFAALAPFWSDLENDTGAVYVDERVVDGVDTLIVQWQDRSYFFQSGTGTFQVQLFDRDPSAARQLVARFAYQDVDFDNVFYDGGAEATIGMQIDPNTGEPISHDAAAVANGDVIDFYVTTGDRYALDLAAGETVTLQTSTPLDGAGAAPVNRLDPAVSVLDDAGAVLATDTNSADGKNASLTFTAPSAGTYVVSVFPESESGEYVLHKMAGAVVDGDFDDDGDYDTTDIDMLTGAIAGNGSIAQFDLSGDGQLSMEDVDLWLAEAGTANLGPGLAYQSGDADLDGVVDGIDFLTWNAHKFTSNNQWSHGDFNADGVIDGLDFLVWNQHKFTSAAHAGRANSTARFTWPTIRPASETARCEMPYSNWLLP